MSQRLIIEFQQQAREHTLPKCAKGSCGSSAVSGDATSLSHLERKKEKASSSHFIRLRHSLEKKVLQKCFYDS